MASRDLSVKVNLIAFIIISCLLILEITLSGKVDVTLQSGNNDLFWKVARRLRFKNGVMVSSIPSLTEKSVQMERKQIPPRLPVVTSKEKSVDRVPTSKVPKKRNRKVVRSFDNPTDPLNSFEQLDSIAGAFTEPFYVFKGKHSATSQKVSYTGVKAVDAFVKGEILSKVASNQTGQHPLGHRKTAVVIICLGSPYRFQFSIKNILSVYLDPRNTAKADFYVSALRFELRYLPIFKEFQQTLKEKNPSLSFTILHFQEEDTEDLGFYSWIMGKLFDSKGYEQILFIEEQVIVSADFFSYFDNISPVMWKDSSILSITALNEYPVKSSKSMPFHVFRSDYMSTGAWLITSKVWVRFGREWSSQSMLRWIRRKEVRKDLACIIPQISRAATFKVVDNKDDPIVRVRSFSLYEGYFDFSYYNTDYLVKENYDQKWNDLIQSATGFGFVQLIPANSKTLSLLYLPPLRDPEFRQVAKRIRLPVAKYQVLPTSYNQSYLTIYRNSWCMATMNIKPITVEP